MSGFRYLVVRGPLKVWRYEGLLRIAFNEAGRFFTFMLTFRRFRLVGYHVSALILRRWRWRYWQAAS